MLVDVKYLRITLTLTSNNIYTHCLSTSGFRDMFRRKSQTSLSSSTYSNSPWDPNVYPGQRGYLSSPASSSSALWSSFSWMYLTNLQREAPRRHLSKTPQLILFYAEEQRVYVTVLSEKKSSPNFQGSPWLPYRLEGASITCVSDLVLSIMIHTSSS